MKETKKTDCIYKNEDCPICPPSPQVDNGFTIENRAHFVDSRTDEERAENMESITTTSSPQEEPWEKRFVEQFDYWDENYPLEYEEFSRLKSFISSTIQEAVRAKGEVLLERVKATRRDEEHGMDVATFKGTVAARAHNKSFNAALSEVEKEIIKLMQ